MSVKSEGCKSDSSYGLSTFELDSNGNVTAFNVWGMNGLLSRRIGTASVYYTFDPKGGVVQRLDSNGNILSTSAYDAWGNPLVPNLNDPFGYDAQWGYYTDNETGLLLPSPTATTTRRREDS